MTESEELAALRVRVEKLESLSVSLLIGVASSLAQHPNYNAAQLHLTALLEQQLGGGVLGSTLTPAQKQNARDAVEWLQAVDSKLGQGPQKLWSNSRPISGSGGDDAKQ